MANIFINIGSNLGDRRLNLSRAMNAVSREFGDFELSHTIESEPWGYASSHRFLNVGMAFSSDLPPEEILAKLQAIEKRLSPGSHRKADGTYADRYIDIDIVAIDMETIDTPRLKVPHPHLPERRFYLEPLEELAPGWRHPAYDLTAGEMISQLEDKNQDHRK